MDSVCRTTDGTVCEFHSSDGVESPEGEVITFGAAEPSAIPWLRSIWMAVILGVPLAGPWIFAAKRSSSMGVVSSGDDIGPSDRWS